MLNEHGKSLFKPWLSVQNVVLGLATLFCAALTIRIYSLNSSEIASWVQAFGSIAAILGAFAISNNQAKHQRDLASAEEQKKRDRFKSLLVLLALGHYEGIRSLKRAVQKANYETGTLRPYFEGGLDLKWPSHLEALKSIDVNQLDPNHLSVLMEMQVAAQYALKLCDSVGADWSPFGEGETRIMERLEHFSTEAKDNLAYLQSSKWDL
ncbi:hypothetical protein ACIPZF_22280 [Pseudomonas sp. NPDC089752]|uniref:hypothetical protein n=1 Tax=Pseudomonas sp. NPDC089752 TaxID=3364472 RepID=UPI00380D869D